jgi:hypothetical protein
MGFIDTAKQWFVSKAKPTQSQYHTLFDYLWFKDQSLPLSAIDELITILQGKLDVSVYNASFLALTIQEVPISDDESIVVPAGYLFEKCIVLPAFGASYRIGLTFLGEEILPLSSISENGDVVVIERYSSTSTTFYFTGLPVGSSVVTFIRKIKDVL